MASFLGFCQREPKYERGSNQITEYSSAPIETEAEKDPGLFANIADLFGGSGPKKSIKLDGDTWIIIATDVNENIYLHDVEPHQNIQLKKCSGGCSVVASQAINKLIVNDCKNFRAVVLGAREVEIKDTQDLTVDFRGLYVPTALRFRNASRCVLNLPPGIDPAVVESDVDSMYSTAMYYQTADGTKIELTPAATKTVVKGGEAHIVPADGDAEKMSKEREEEPGEMPAEAVDQLPAEPVLSTAEELLPVPVKQTYQDSVDDVNNALADAVPANSRGGLDINGPANGQRNLDGLDPFSPPPNLPGRPRLVPDVEGPPEPSPMRGDIAGRLFVPAAPADPTPDVVVEVPEEPVTPTPDVPWYQRNLSPGEVPPLAPPSPAQRPFAVGPTIPATPPAPPSPPRQTAVVAPPAEPAPPAPTLGPAEPGVTLRSDVENNVRINDIIPGSPAQREGSLRRGDIVHRIDDVSVRKMDAKQASAYLMGPVGSRVTVEGERDLDRGPGVPAKPVAVTLRRVVISDKIAWAPPVEASEPEVDLNVTDVPLSPETEDPSDARKEQPVQPRPNVRRSSDNTRGLDIFAVNQPQAPPANYPQPVQPPVNYPQSPESNYMYPQTPTRPVFSQSWNNQGTPLGREPLSPGEFQG